MARGLPISSHGTARIKVLFMSGYTANALARNDQLDSEVEFLHKPFTPAALTRKVRKVLDA